VFAQPDPLPGAKVELAVGHGHGQVGAQEAGLDVSRLKNKRITIK